MKKFTNLRFLSSQRKRTIRVFINCRRSLCIILTGLLLVSSMSLFSEEYHGGQIGGNMPCYIYGQIIGWTFWDDGGIFYAMKRTYIGDCTIKSEWWKDNVYWKSALYGGGCNCDFPMAPYDIIEYPLTSFQVQYWGPGSFGLNTTIDLSKMEVWQLTENGDIVYTYPDAIPANQTIEFPISVFQDGQDYIVIGYDLLNNTSTYLSIRKATDTIEELKIFCSWGPGDSTHIQRDCVTYVSSDSIMIFMQHLDKSGQIVKGSTTGSVGINERKFTDAFVMELSQNYPNPFNTSTTIDITILRSSNVRLVIYDIQGKEIERFVDCYLAPAKYQFIWNASNYQSGTFYYQLISDYAIETKKMVLLK